MLPVAVSEAAPVVLSAMTTGLLQITVRANRLERLEANLLDCPGEFSCLARANLAREVLAMSRSFRGE